VIGPREGVDVHTAHKILEIHQIFVAVREGNLRVSPHLYNSTADLERLVEVLKLAHS
jgi:selenocysteine lyase/cysteine desulfurase